MRSVRFAALAFAAAVSSASAQGWFDTLNDAKRQLPDSLRSRIDGALSNDGVRRSFEETQRQLSRALDEITPEEEYYVGRAVAAKILAKYRVLDCPQAQGYLNRILHSLTVFSERPILFRDYCVVILDSDEVNAFATAGGHVMVTRGLVSCADSEDALAAVLAHEVGHVLLKHSAKAIKSARLGGAAARAGGTAGLALNASGSGVSVDADALRSEIDAAVTEVIETGYSQSQELSADTKALELLDGAGYDPRAMDSVLKALKAALKAQGKSGGGFSRTHPSPDVRLKNVSIRYRFYPPSGSYSPPSSRAARFAEFRRALGAGGS